MDCYDHNKVRGPRAFIPYSSSSQPVGDFPPCG